MRQPFTLHGILYPLRLVTLRKVGVPEEKENGVEGLLVLTCREEFANFEFKCTEPSVHIFIQEKYLYIIYL